MICDNKNKSVTGMLAVMVSPYIHIYACICQAGSLRRFSRTPLLLLLRIISRSSRSLSVTSHIFLRYFFFFSHTLPSRSSRDPSGMQTFYINSIHRHVHLHYPSYDCETSPGMPLELRPIFFSIFQPGLTLNNYPVFQIFYSNPCFEGPITLDQALQFYLKTSSIAHQSVVLRCSILFHSV